MLDPGYFTFTERGLVAAPEHHNIILVDGAGPTDYLSGSLGWLADPLGRPPVDGHAMLSHTLDAEGLDAARVTTRYGQPADRAALIERRFLFADDRYLVVADTVQGPADPPQDYTWLLHGNGGGDSGGTFMLTTAGGRWVRPAAALDVAVSFDRGAPAFSTTDAVHETDNRARATHAVLRAAASGPAVRSVMLAYPSPAGRAPAPPIALAVAPDAAAVQITDIDADRRVLALHRAASSPITIGGAAIGMLDVETDGALVVVDASADGAFLNLAWADDATRIAYGAGIDLSTRTRGRLGVRQREDRVDIVADVTDPLVVIAGLGFDPAVATAPARCCPARTSSSGASAASPCATTARTRDRPPIPDHSAALCPRRWSRSTGAAAVTPTETS